jgi:organic hydroperoxide reductase OsmC/OhrA
MAHEYFAEIIWSRSASDFPDGRYSRAHVWRFDGAEIPASASPQVVRLPFSRADAVDPEEALVAAVSSCHMLSFLYLAAKAGHVVQSYVDNAVGVMGRNERGREAITDITLRPAIVFAGKEPDADQLHALHEHAHDDCYIANSVTARIRVEAREPATAKETSH